MRPTGSHLRVFSSDQAYVSEHHSGDKSKSNHNRRQFAVRGSSRNAGERSEWKIIPKFLALPLAGGKGRDKKDCIWVISRLKYV